MEGTNSVKTVSPKDSRKPRRKRLRALFGILLVGIPSFFCVANAMVLNAGKGKIYEDMNSLPHHRVGLVLGCAPMVGKAKNTFFLARIEAAANLYKGHKVDRLLVSGDNGRQGYDEPTAMLEALIAKGIPKEHITADYAGFRTLDSMVRATKVFGITDATIITDDFHMARSLYYDDHAGLQADGFPSKAPENPMTASIEFREVLARGRAVLDEAFHISPKFLGKKEVIR